MTFFALAVFIVWGIPYFFQTPPPEAAGSPIGTGTVKAEVTAILEEGMVDLGGTVQTYQLLRVKLLEGEYAGIPMDVDYGKRQIHPEGVRFDVGDVILVATSVGPDNHLNAYFVDYVRTPMLGWLALAFALAIIVMGKWKGFRSLLALAFSLLVIIAYIIPHILNGEDPVRVSIIGATILLTVTLYVTYGWTLKTHASVLGMILVLVLTGTLAWFAIQLTRLAGTASEEALFLIQMSAVTINLRGLMLGGMIIGALGVLDDLVTTQASAVFELKQANPHIAWRGLFRSAMRIGQDQVRAATKFSECLEQQRNLPKRQQPGHVGKLQLPDTPGPFHLRQLRETIHDDRRVSGFFRQGNIRPGHGPNFSQPVLSDHQGGYLLLQDPRFARS